MHETFGVYNLALPEDVGGMLLDDGGVEVACTPLHAVASVITP